MKKFLALLLAVMMIASMSVTAFAAEDVEAKDIRKELKTDAATEGKTADVNVVIKNNDNESMTADTVYFVVVEWKSMDFTFKFTNTTDTEIKWDPTQHAYVNASNEKLEGAWQADDTNDITVSGTAATQENAVKITNHSNATVTVGAAVNTTAVNGVETTISEGTDVVLPSAVGLTTTDGSLSKAWNVTVSGTPTVVTDYKVSVVTLTISK